MKITRYPIQIIYRRQHPGRPQSPARTGAVAVAPHLRAAIRRHHQSPRRRCGTLHLPTVGVFGNTHFPFSDLNNLKIAELLSKFLNRKGLDRYPNRHNDDDKGHDCGPNHNEICP